MGIHHFADTVLGGTRVLVYHRRSCIVSKSLMASRYYMKDNLKLLNISLLPYTGLS